MTLASLKKPTQSFGPRRFVIDLLEQLAADGWHTLPISDPAMEESIRSAIHDLKREALRQWDEGNDDYASMLMDIVDSVRPDPNTGSNDNFWAMVRRQQPAFGRVSNPNYATFELKAPRPGKKEVSQTETSFWQKLVKNFASQIEDQSAADRSI